jgi:hypothetical protein
VPPLDKMFRPPFQESSDGQSMMEFRHSLPAYKERQALLEAISQNQVFLFIYVLCHKHICVHCFIIRIMSTISTPSVSFYLSSAGDKYFKMELVQDNQNGGIELSSSHEISTLSVMYFGKPISFADGEHEIT